jgi:hypothetical protein
MKCIGWTFHTTVRPFFLLHHYSITSVRTWNETAVRTWAESLKISKQSAKKISENHVLGSDLIHFDFKDLKQMGISGEDLRRLSDEINELQRLHQRQMKSKSTSDLPS